MRATLPPLPAPWARSLDPLLPPHWDAMLASKLGNLDDQKILPPQPSWLRAFDIPPEKARVLIIGQDPYHGPGQANGLAFSVSAGVPIPPSLRNIIKQAKSEGFACAAASTGDLGGWHDQGVMLLNTCLTVSPAQPGSHHGWGWETLTDAVVGLLSQAPGHRVFMLWGASARTKRVLVNSRHLVLESAHPSPLSAYRGFFGNAHFTAANTFLQSKGQPPIRW